MTDADSSVPGFDFALAGTWWRIPVANEAEADRAIKGIITDAAGRSDELATFRHLIREQLTTTVADARKVDAKYLYLAREISPGLPLSASLGIYWPPLGDLPSEVAQSPKLARAFLKTLLHEADASGGFTEEHEFEAPAGAVMRRGYRQARELDDGTVAETIRADYWLIGPDTGRFVLFSFSSQFVSLETELLGLFDAILSTVEWKRGSEPPAAGTAAGSSGAS